MRRCGGSAILAHVQGSAAVRCNCRHCSRGGCCRWRSSVMQPWAPALLLHGTLACRSPGSDPVTSPSRRLAPLAPMAAALTVPLPAQSLTKKPVKGMLTGPVTILNWSFPRKDISRRAQAFQLGLALRAEVADLEAAGCTIIQVPRTRPLPCPLPQQADRAQQSQPGCACSAGTLPGAASAWRPAPSGLLLQCQACTNAYPVDRQVLSALAGVGGRACPARGAAPEERALGCLPGLGGQRLQAGNHGGPAQHADRDPPVLLGVCGHPGGAWLWQPRLHLLHAAGGQAAQYRMPARAGSERLCWTQGDRPTSCCKQKHV